MNYLLNPNCFHLLSNCCCLYYFLYQFYRKIHSNIMVHQILTGCWLHSNLLMSCLFKKDQYLSNLFHLIFYYYLQRFLALNACSFLQVYKMFLYREKLHLLARQIHRSLLSGLYVLFNIYRLFLLSTQMNSFHLRRKYILDLNLINLYLFYLHNLHH